MYLKDLLSLKSDISIYNVTKILEEINYLQENIKNLNADGDIVFENFKKDKLNVLNNVYQTINQSISDIENIKESYDQKINHLVQKYNNTEYDEKLIKIFFYGKFREQLNEIIPEEILTKIISKIKGYSNYRFPALELGCRQGFFTKELVASDPFYIVDFHNQFLENSANQFNQQYQKRIRTYKIEMHKDLAVKNLSMLPKNQFNLVFSWHFFNFLSIRQAQYYIEQIFNLLRPGGTAMFSYNNCATVNGAMRVDPGDIAAYINGLELQKICLDIGYEITNAEDLSSGDISWLEITKPGELTTVKASQSLGEISIGT